MVRTAKSAPYLGNVGSNARNGFRMRAIGRFWNRRQLTRREHRRFLAYFTSQALEFHNIRPAGIDLIADVSSGFVAS